MAKNKVISVKKYLDTHTKPDRKKLNEYMNAFMKGNGKDESPNTILAGTSYGRIVMGPTINDKLLHALDIDPMKWKDYLKTNKDYKVQGVIAVNPVYVGLLNLYVNTVTEKGIKVKNKEIVGGEDILLTMVTKMYSARISQYLKYTPNKNRMNGVIAGLSKKYSIKRLGSIKAVLMEMGAMTMYNHLVVAKRADRMNDKDFALILKDLYSRINKSIKSIAGKVYDSKEEMFISSDISDTTINATVNFTALLGMVEERTMKKLHVPNKNLISLVSGGDKKLSANILRMMAEVSRKQDARIEQTKSINILLDKFKVIFEEKLHGDTTKVKANFIRLLISSYKTKGEDDPLKKSILATLKIVGYRGNSKTSKVTVSAVLKYYILVADTVIREEKL